MTIPACPSHTGMCYEETDCDGGKARDLQQLLIWSWDQSPCVCGLHTPHTITLHHMPSQCVPIQMKGQSNNEEILESSIEFREEHRLDTSDVENMRNVTLNIHKLIAVSKPIRHRE